MATRRTSLERFLRDWLPDIPAWEAGEVVAHVLATPSMKALPAPAAVRLAAVAFVRHRFTDYDDLLDQGWGVEAARHFVAGPTLEVLGQWGARDLPDLGEADGEPGGDWE